MLSERSDIEHFFLTRFNLLLWKKDKEGHAVRTKKWLKHRFDLFEHFCLPSVVNQTCQNFKWIVLFDATTPEEFKLRVKVYQSKCAQFIPVFVEPAEGRYFAEIFRKEILERKRSKRILTTYLDNDDALNKRFAEDLQQRASFAADGTFFYYDTGFQYYTDSHLLLQIDYPKNHFVSVVECGQPDVLKGIFGYGGHYYLDKIVGNAIEHIKAEPMWCEVVHEKNMINDANFLIGTKVIKDKKVLREIFSVNEDVDAGMGVYCFKFLPRYMRTFMKRAKNKLFGRKW